MPNHVTTIVEMSGPQESINKFFETIKGEDTEFDFGKIIPPPDNLYTGNLSSDKKEELNDKGIPNWYDWNMQNWGTKWNAYSIDSQPEYNTIQFNTAWAMPYPVLLEASSQFPDILFKVKYADEDLGYNCGQIHFKDGGTIDRRIYDGSKEYGQSVRFASEVKGCKPFKIIGEGDDVQIFWQEEDYQNYLLSEPEPSE